MAVYVVCTRVTPDKYLQTSHYLDKVKEAYEKVCGGEAEKEGE